MNISYLISTLLAVTATAYAASNFYAIINGRNITINNFAYHERDYLITGWPPNNWAPKFTLDKGVISIGEGENKKVFGFAKDGLLAFGKAQTMETVHIQLDDQSKILNFRPYFCKWARSRKYSGFLRKTNSASRRVKCFPMDLYFQCDNEEERESAYHDRHKRDMRNVPDEVEEEMVSLKSASLDDHNVYIDSPTIELRQRAVDDRRVKGRNRRTGESIFVSIFSILR